MARFHFPLQAVLEQRRRAERDAMLAVAALERERLEVEGEIEACRAAAEQERRDLRDLLHAERSGGGVDVRAARSQAHASLHAVARAQRLVVRLAGVHERIDRARLALLEAATARQAVETLRDKQFEEWRAEQARLEAAALDDLVVARHGRQDRMSGGEAC